ncbi:MAG: hypothetical protein PUC11_02470 [Elusimicrobia bacterium]|nr:hypothetical protein [Elusimicrobiota bacterium]
MIENIILKVLKADAELAELLDGRIYPDVAQVSVLPAVVMAAGEPVSPINEPWYYTQNLTFEIYAGDVKTAQAVRNRLYEVLQKYDDFFCSDLANSGIIIREAHAVASSVSNHFELGTEQAKEKLVSFDFKYTKCAE